MLHDNVCASLAMFVNSAIFITFLQLAPNQPLQDDFIFHWKAVTSFFLENRGEILLLIVPGWY